MIESVEAVNRITQAVIGAAMRVHSALGPGLLESAYESCLAFELEELGMRDERQKALPVVYRDLRIECGYRLDLVVEHAVIVELKSVEALERVHVAQMLTYLKLSRYPLGLLINFNVVSLKSGIRRVILTPKGAPDAPNHL
jgi:GxxExxY protein